MIEVLFARLWAGLCAGLRALDHAWMHAVSWVIEADVFRFGACSLCGLERNQRACERRQAATGRYYR